MTAPATTFETEEERQARLLREQGQADSASATNAPGGSSQAPGSAGASPSVSSPTPSQPTGTPRATSTSIPSGFAPPPPPPPPVPPDVAALNAKAIDFSSDWLSDPNPYEGAAATAARTASEANLTQAQKDQERQIAEWAQGRGLVGSSYEGDQQVQLAGTMQRARQDFDAQLLDKIAAAEAANKAAAGSNALATVGQANAADLARYNAALDAARLGETQREFGVTSGQAQQDIDLRAKALVQEAATQGRTLDLQAARDQATQEYQQGQLALATTTNAADIDLRAKALVQEAALQGRTLDLQSARDQATQEYQQAQLAQQGSQFTQTLAQQESQFAQTMGLNQQQFELQSRTAAQQYGEQVASRLQQNAQWQTTLQSQNARDAMDAGLRQAALDLQAKGMTMDAAYKQAALDQERNLTLSAQQIQQQGITADQAYKYAALMQDAKFRQDANDLQRAGLDANQAYQLAELNFQNRSLEQNQSQFTSNLDFQKWLAEQNLGIPAAGTDTGSTQEPTTGGDTGAGATPPGETIGQYPSRGGKYLVYGETGTSEEVARQQTANTQPVQLYGEPQDAFNARLEAWQKRNGTTAAATPGVPAPGVTLMPPAPTEGGATSDAGALQAWLQQPPTGNEAAAPATIAWGTAAGDAEIARQETSSQEPVQLQGEDLGDYYARVRAWQQRNNVPVTAGDTQGGGNQGVLNWLNQQQQ